MSHILEAISCLGDPGVLFVKAFWCCWTLLQDRSQSRGLATLCTCDGRWESLVISGNNREAHSLPRLTSHPGSPAIPSLQSPMPFLFPGPFVCLWLLFVIFGKVNSVEVYRILPTVLRRVEGGRLVPTGRIPFMPTTRKWLAQRNDFFWTRGFFLRGAPSPYPPYPT